MTHPSAPRPRVASPCIKVCVLDARSVCIGCGRTIDEIARWSHMSEDQQRQACDRAQERLQQAMNNRSG